MLRSRSHCRAHQRLPPLEEKGSIYLLDAADTHIYNQLLKCRGVGLGGRRGPLIQGPRVSVSESQISLQHTSQRINMKQLGQLVLM